MQSTQKKDFMETEMDVSPDIDSEAAVFPDWTTSEERRTRLRLDLVLLPIMMVGFFTLQMDRGNLANVLTSTIVEDLKITTDQINYGSQMLLAAIVLLELPSNILMQYVGPYYILSVQIVLWGLVATFQIFITNYAGFMATRFLLGLSESGFVPGCLFFLTTWYKRSETSSRVSLFYVGQGMALVIANLLAAAILNLEGAEPLGGGWRWVWMIEGVITLFVAIVFVLLLPQGIHKARPFISFGRWNYFTKRQRHILTQRLILEDSTGGKEKAKITVRQVLDTFRNYRLWLHIFVTMTAACAVHGLNIYTPRMIKGFGFSSVHANALSAVAPFIGMVLNVALAFLSDRLNHRGPFVLLAATWNVISWACLTTVAGMTNKWQQYAAIVLANACSTTVPILNVGWLLVHCKTPQDRSISSAIIIIAVNLGGLSGGNVLSADDAPEYYRGIRVMTGIGAVCWALTAGLGLSYYWADKRAKA
ncbi:major facilitator superfamily domain-containing protein [Ilyonectria destructans]|nr:major facilitator superfamily domain-containing protein [Ilyonectria destructans]